MSRAFFFALSLLLLAGFAHAGDPSPAHLNLALQIALEREGFSPGLIDGQTGPKTTLALKTFQQARGLRVSGVLDYPTTEALKVNEVQPLSTYVVTAEDASKVTGALPKSWYAKAKMPYLGYETLAGAVAERFHCSQGLLAKLNPRKDLSRLKQGDELTVPTVLAAKTPRLASLEINFSQKTIRGLDSRGQVLALFHCSIAKDAARRPSGSAGVVSATNNPAYSFDPKMWPEVKGVKDRLLINPGPRNPVGLCWIALSLKGYGIHGTPNPELIGKTGSHGCFRLTNWDAVRLGKMVESGTPIAFR